MRLRHTFAALLLLLLLLACTASGHDEQIVDGLGDDAHDVEIHHAIQHYLHKIAPKCPPPPSTEDPSCEDEVTSDEDEYGTGGVEPESSHSREHWADHVARMEADKDHAERARLANEAEHKHKTCCRCHRKRHDCSDEIQIPPHYFCGCPCHSHPLPRENRAATKADKELLAQLGSSDEVVLHSPSRANEEGVEYGKIMKEALDEAKTEDDDTSALVGSPEEDSEKEPGEAEVAAEPTIPEVGGHHNKLAEDPQEGEDDEVKTAEETSAPIADSARAPEASPESTQQQDEEEEQSDGGAQPEAEEQEQQEQPEAEEQEQQEERQEEDEAEPEVQQEEDEIEAPMLPEPEAEREEEREEERDEQQAQAREEEQAQEEGREDELKQEVEEKHHHHSRHSTIGFPEHHRVWNNEPKQFDELLEEPRTGKEAFDKPEAEKSHHYHGTGNRNAREASEDVVPIVEAERQRSRESIDDEPQVTAADTVEEPVAEEETTHHHKHHEEEQVVLEATSGASNEQVHFERHEGHLHQEHSSDASLALDSPMHHQSHHAYSDDVEATASDDIVDRMPHHYKVSSEEVAPEQVSALPHEHHSRVVSGYEASDEQAEYPGQGQHVSYDGQDMSLRQFIELAERVEHPPHHRHHYPHYYGRPAEVAEEQQAAEKLEEGLQYENGHEHHDDDAAKLVRAAEDENEDDEEAKERKLISDQLRHPDTDVPDFEEPDRDPTKEQAEEEEKETGSSNEQPKDWFGMVAAEEREKDGTVLEESHQHRSTERTSNVEDMTQTEHVASAEYPANDPSDKEAPEDDATEISEGNEIANDQESKNGDAAAEKEEAVAEETRDGINDDDAAVAEAVEQQINNKEEDDRGNNDGANNAGDDNAADDEDGEEIQELHRVRKHADQAEDTPANEEQKQEELPRSEDKDAEDIQTSPIATEEYAPVADVFVPDVVEDQALVPEENFTEGGTSSNANEEAEQFEEAPAKSEVSNNEASAENMQQVSEAGEQSKHEGEEAVDADLVNPSETTLDREERRIEHPEHEYANNVDSNRNDDEEIGQEAFPKEAQEESHVGPAETNQEPTNIAEQPVIEDVQESDRDVEAEMEEAPTNNEVIAEANEEIAEIEGQNGGDIRPEQQTSEKQNEAAEEALEKGVSHSSLEPEETASETLPQAVTNKADEQINPTENGIAEDEPSLTGEEEAVEEQAEEAAVSPDKAADEPEQNIMPEEDQAGEAIDAVDSVDQPAAEESYQNLTPIEDQQAEAIEMVDSLDQPVEIDEDSAPEIVAEEGKEIEELPADDHAEEVGVQAIEHVDDTVLPDEVDDDAGEGALSEAEATLGIPAEVVQQAEDSDMSGAPVDPIVPEVARAETEINREALEETANIPDVQSTADQPELSADEETVVDNADEAAQAEVPGQPDSENPSEAENPIESVVDEEEEQAEREVADNNMALLQDEETPEEQQVEREESTADVMDDTVDGAEENKIADDAPASLEDVQESADDVADAVSDNASFSSSNKAEADHEEAEQAREHEASPQGEGTFEPELPANDEPADTDSISDLPPDLDAPVPLPGEVPPNLDEELPEEKKSGDDGMSDDLPADAKPEVDNNEPDVYNEQSQPQQQPATSHNQGHTKMTVNVVHEKEMTPSQSEQKPLDNAKPNKPLFTLNIPLGSTDKTVNQKKSENSAATADHTAAATEESHPVKQAKPATLSDSRESTLSSYARHRHASEESESDQEENDEKKVKGDHHQGGGKAEEPEETYVIDDNDDVSDALDAVNALRNQGKIAPKSIENEEKRHVRIRRQHTYSRRHGYDQDADDDISSGINGDDDEDEEDEDDARSPQQQQQEYDLSDDEEEEADSSATSAEKSSPNGYESQVETGTKSRRMQESGSESSESQQDDESGDDTAADDIERYEDENDDEDSALAQEEGEHDEEEGNNDRSFAQPKHTSSRRLDSSKGNDIEDFNEADAHAAKYSSFNQKNRDAYKDSASVKKHPSFTPNSMKSPTKTKEYSLGNYATTPARAKSEEAVRRSKVEGKAKEEEAEGDDDETEEDDDEQSDTTARAAEGESTQTKNEDENKTTEDDDNSEDEQPEYDEAGDEQEDADANNGEHEPDEQTTIAEQSHSEETNPEGDQAVDQSDSDADIKLHGASSESTQNMEVDKNDPFPQEDNRELVPMRETASQDEYSATTTSMPTMMIDGQKKEDANVVNTENASNSVELAEHTSPSESEIENRDVSARKNSTRPHFSQHPIGKDHVAEEADPTAALINNGGATTEVPTLAISSLEKHVEEDHGTVTENGQQEEVDNQKLDRNTVSASKEQSSAENTTTETTIIPNNGDDENAVRDSKQSKEHVLFTLHLDHEATEADGHVAPVHAQSATIVSTTDLPETTTEAIADQNDEEIPTESLTIEAQKSSRVEDEYSDDAKTREIPDDGDSSDINSQVNSALPETTTTILPTVQPKKPPIRHPLFSLHLSGKDHRAQEADGHAAPVQHRSGDVTTMESPGNTQVTTTTTVATNDPDVDEIGDALPNETLTIDDPKSGIDIAEEDYGIADNEIGAKSENDDGSDMISQRNSAENELLTTTIISTLSSTKPPHRHPLFTLHLPGEHLATEADGHAAPMELKAIELTTSSVPTTTQATTVDIIRQANEDEKHGVEKSIDASNGDEENDVERGEPSRINDENSLSQISTMEAQAEPSHRQPLFTLLESRNGTTVGSEADTHAATREQQFTQDQSDEFHDITDIEKNQSAPLPAEIMNDTEIDKEEAKEENKDARKDKFVSSEHDVSSASQVNEIAPSIQKPLFTLNAPGFESKIQEADGHASSQRTIEKAVEVTTEKLDSPTIMPSTAVPDIPDIVITSAIPLSVSSRANTDRALKTTTTSEDSSEERLLNRSFDEENVEPSSKEYGQLPSSKLHLPGNAENESTTTGQGSDEDLVASTAAMASNDYDSHDASTATETTTSMSPNPATDVTTSKATAILGATTTAQQENRATASTPSLFQSFKAATPQAASTEAPSTTTADSNAEANRISQNLFDVQTSHEITTPSTEATTMESLNQEQQAYESATHKDVVSKSRNHERTSARPATSEIYSDVVSPTTSVAPSLVDQEEETLRITPPAEVANDETTTASISGTLAVTSLETTTESISGTLTTPTAAVEEPVIHSDSPSGVANEKTSTTKQPIIGSEEITTLALPTTYFTTKGPHAEQSSTSPGTTEMPITAKSIQFMKAVDSSVKQHEEKQHTQQENVMKHNTNATGTNKSKPRNSARHPLYSLHLTSARGAKSKVNQTRDADAHDVPTQHSNSPHRPLYSLHLPGQSGVKAEADAHAAPLHSRVESSPSSHTLSAKEHTSDSEFTNEKAARRPHLMFTLHVPNKNTDGNVEKLTRAHRSTLLDS